MLIMYPEAILLKKRDFIFSSYIEDRGVEKSSIPIPLHKPIFQDFSIQKSFLFFQNRAKLTYSEVKWTPRLCRKELVG